MTSASVICQVVSLVEVAWIVVYILLEKGAPTYAVRVDLSPARAIWASQVISVVLRLRVIILR